MSNGNVLDLGSTNVALALDVDFPSNVVPGPGIAIDKSSATWTVSLGYPPLAENTHVVPTNNYYLAVYDVAGVAYEKVRLDTLISSATGLDTRTPMGDASYIATVNDRYIGIATAFTLNRTLSLPPAAGVPGGREIAVQDEIGTLNAQHYLVVVTTGADTIDGKAQRILSTAYGGIKLRSNGTNAWNVVAGSAVTPVNDSGYTCNPDDHVIAFTALTAARTVTLPLAANYVPGQRLIVMDQAGLATSTHTITVIPQGADTINGLTSAPPINTASGFLGIVCDGISKWTIVDTAIGGAGTSITSAQITDASPLGRLLLTQATAALDRTSLGSQATGDAMFLAATPAAGRAVLGSGAVGDAVFISATQAAAQSAMGLGTMATQNANAVAITGGSITGVAGLGSTVTVADTPPGSPAVGALWYDSAGAQLYVWYNDGTSSQWVIATNQNLAGAYLPITGGTVTGPVVVQGDVTMASLNGGPLAGQRNRIINGDMRIDQRHAGAAVNALPLFTTYLVDRWAYLTTQAGHFNAGQNLSGGGGALGLPNTIGLAVASAYTTAATDYNMLTQSIEGFNISDLQWGTAGALSVTLSFWVYSTTVTGTHSGALVNGAGTLGYPFTFSVPTANAWTKIAVTIPGSTTGTWASDTSAGLLVRFNLGSGANFLAAAGAWSAGNWMGATGAVNLAATSGAYLYITGVQLEPGTVATPFERRLYGTELALCQRYYQRFVSTQPGAIFVTNAATVVAPGIVLNTMLLPVTMRSAPTGSYIGTWTLANCTALTIDSSGSSVRLFTNATANGGVTFNSPANGGFDLAAEL
jgi:hypothetical protein